MKRGVYLVTEQGCMNPTTGAYRHITVGVEELSRYFNIELVAPLPAPKSTQAATEKTPPENSASPKKKPGAFRGMLKDLKTLIQNHRRFFRLYRTIKATRPEFIYERLAYLNFNGLIIAKLLRIKHFYEANGVPHHAIKKFYSSYFNRVVKAMEERAFAASDFLFIVGSWNKIMKLRKDNWVSIENGIEDAYLRHFAPILKKVNGSKINLLFIGHLMQRNHQPQLLMDVLKEIPDKQSFCLNLVGTRMDQLVTFCEQHHINVVDHGFAGREKMVDILEQMHIGIIPGGEEYPSFMKIFEYGASKCLVIAPNLYNLSYWFTGRDILFFQKNDANDFRSCLIRALNNKELIGQYGSHIHETIREKYTWPKIFSQIHSIIISRVQ